MTEVVVLGTGSADGWPNPFCGCASCMTERAAGRVRGQTSALVDGALLLDCGPETPRAAERSGVDLRRLRHVLITHAHPDHYSPGFLLYRSWVGEEPLDVVGPPEVIEQARMWVSPDSSVNFVTVTPGQLLRLGRYDVRVLAARHGPVGSSVLYDVTATDVDRAPGTARTSGTIGTTRETRLLFATDTGPLPQETLEAVREAAFDLVLLEETFGDRTTHGTDHLDLSTFADEVRRLRDVGALTEDTELVAVHLSHHNPPTAELARRLAAWDARVVDDGTRLTVPHVQPPLPRRPGTLRTLVIGGARSGKSREAERLLAAEPEVTYVATGYPAGDDPEWAARVERHRADRPAHWRTVESLDIAGLLRVDGGPLLVDCLTLWLTRVMDAHDAWDDQVWVATGQKAVREEIDALLDAWRHTPRRVVAVTNEVGQGVVPDTAAGRRFRDTMGRLNAEVAASTEDVRWCLAGRVTRL